MLEYVLTVAGAVAQAAEDLDELGIEPVDTDLEGRAFAGLLDAGLDLRLGLFDHFLDAGRMDPAVADEALERDAGHLAADGIEPGNGDGVGRIVDDELDAGELLELADVAALTADDASLHFLAGNGDGGDGRLGDVICRAALNGQRNDVFGLFVGFVLELFFEDSHSHCLLVLHFIDHFFDELVPCLLLGHTGNSLECDELFCLEPVYLSGSFFVFLNLLV